MKFDVYGRLQIQVVREGDAWIAYRLEPGKRILLDDLSIPTWMSAEELAVYLDDIYHEMGGPGDIVRPIP